MVISVAHLLIILLTFKNNIVWLLTISPTDDISVLRIQQYVPCMSNITTNNFILLREKFQTQSLFFCLSLKDLLKYWKVKKIK